MSSKEAELLGYAGPPNAYEMEEKNQSCIMQLYRVVALASITVHARGYVPTWNRPNTCRPVTRGQ